MRMYSLRLSRSRVCRSLTVVIVLTMLAMGCGSTGDGDQLVFQVTEFNGDNITQPDAVGSSSADVDVIQDACGATPPTPEPFSQTLFNAVFENNEGLDIRLSSYTVHVNDSRLGLGDFSAGTTATIRGGRCVNDLTKQCALDTDCTQGTSTSTCTHLPTTVSGLVLFDLSAKTAIAAQPEVFHQALTVTISFFAADPNQSFQTSGNYLVTFADFDNCTSTTGGAGA